MDGRGVPLSIIVTAANVNDGKRIDEVLSAIVVKREPTPIRRSKHLCADAGYRSAEALRIIDSHGYIPHVVDRRQEAQTRVDPAQPARRDAMASLLECSIMPASCCPLRREATS